MSAPNAHVDTLGVSNDNFDDNHSDSSVPTVMGTSNRTQAVLSFDAPVRVTPSPDHRESYTRTTDPGMVLLTNISTPTMNVGHLSPNDPQVRPLALILPE